MPEVGGPLSSPEPIETTRPLEQGLQEVRLALGARADLILPDGKPVERLTKESFDKFFPGTELPQSVPGTGSDGSLYTISFADGKESFVLRHRTSDGNPFANLSPLGGLDMRQWETFTYEWDGNNTIKATEPNGKVTSVGPPWGTPDKMLPTLRESLGHPRGTETFASTPQPNPPQ